MRKFSVTQNIATYLKDVQNNLSATLGNRRGSVRVPPVTIHQTSLPRDIFSMNGPIHVLMPVCCFTSLRRSILRVKISYAMMSL